MRIITAEYHLLKSLKFIGYLERLMCLPFFYARRYYTYNSWFSPPDNKERKV